MITVLVALLQENARLKRRLEMAEKSLARSQGAHRKTLAELQDGKLNLRSTKARLPDGPSEHHPTGS